MQFTVIMLEKAVEKMPLAKKRCRRIGVKVAVVVLFCMVAFLGGFHPAEAPSWAERTTATVAKPSVTSLESPSQKPQQLQVSTVPVAGAVGVNPAETVTVIVDNGTIQRVALAEQGTGNVIAGAKKAGNRSWASTEPLSFERVYKLDYDVKDLAGAVQHSSSFFTTVPHRSEANAWVHTPNGAQVGVGQPVQINFSEPVVNKMAVEQAIMITSSAGQVGDFHWYNDKMVRYRPPNFWAPHSTVTVDMRLFGVDLGGGQIGNANVQSVMRIGDKQIVVADAQAKKAQFFVNDELVRTMNVTMGDERFPSASGFSVVVDKQKKARFDAETIGLSPGDPAYYGKLDIQYAMRLAQSGIFMHQATDSALRFLGEKNLSHGCIGLSPEDAEAIFDQMLVGSVVQGIHTGNDSIAPQDGFGDWNIPWAQWAKR